MNDRTIKWLLGLIVLGLWACALRPWLGPTPARAQATGGGMPPPDLYTAPSPSLPSLLGVSASGIAYVVSGNSISAYSVEGNPRHLQKIGQESIPTAPMQPMQNLPEPRAY